MNAMATGIGGSRGHPGDPDARGLKRPEFVIVDGAPGLEAALVALWGDDVAVQRCTVHSEGGNATGPNDRPNRNLLAHAPKHMHEELGNDYRDMIYADTAAEMEKRRKAFVGKTAPPDCFLILLSFASGG